MTTAAQSATSTQLPAAICQPHPLSVVAPLVRIALGGLLIFSGWMKLGIYDFAFLKDLAPGFFPLRVLSPQDFAFSINGFKMGLPDELTRFLAYTIPWGEMFIGLAIFAGLWARSACWLAILMLASFTAGIISVITRGLDVNCPCFGAIKLFCSGAIGPCHVVRNSGFMAAAAFILWVGSGPLSVDRLFGERR